MVEAI
jgi:TBC1 domain family protein 5